MGTNLYISCAKQDVCEDKCCTIVYQPEGTIEQRFKIVCPKNNEHKRTTLFPEPVNPLNDGHHS